MGFSHLRKLDVKVTDAVWFKLPAIEGEPEFLCHPAQEVNKPYFNAVLRESRKHARALQKGNMTVEMIEENRERDRRLFPVHVIKDWKRVKDDKGKDVPFSKEECEAFLKALPDWLFDELREAAQATNNYVEVGDSGQLAKN